jgi:hypothetical protein
VAYRADDHGDSFATATALAGSLSGGTAAVETYGIISGSGTSNDRDVFALEVAAGGNISLTVSPATRAYTSDGSGPIYAGSPFTMLDVSLELFDAAFNRVHLSSEPGRLDASVDMTNLAGGTYYLVLDGVGIGDPGNPAPTGYTEYGSLGQYMIRGSYSAGGIGSTPPSPPQAGRLVVDSASLRTGEDGEDAAFTVRAEGATGEVTVRIGGLDSGEGGLAATSVRLDAANGWTATIGVAGRNDGNRDGDAGYRLELGADGFDGAAVSVLNADNEISPLDAGTASGAYAAAPTVEGGAAELTAGDGNARTITEGVIGTVSRMVWRWRFDGLAAGDARVHLDVSSTGERFKMQYSTDGSTWRDFSDGPGLANAWAGDFLAEGITESGELRLRLLDGVRSADWSRDSFAIDLVTIEGTVPAEHDWLA